MWSAWNKLAHSKYYMLKYVLLQKYVFSKYFQMDKSQAREEKTIFSLREVSSISDSFSLWLMTMMMKMMEEEIAWELLT